MTFPLLSQLAFAQFLSSYVRKQTAGTFFGFFLFIRHGVVCRGIRVSQYGNLGFLSAALTLGEGALRGGNRVAGGF